MQRCSAPHSASSQLAAVSCVRSFVCSFVAATNRTNQPTNQRRNEPTNNEHPDASASEVSGASLANEVVGRAKDYFYQEGNWKLPLGLHSRIQSTSSRRVRLRTENLRRVAHQVNQRHEEWSCTRVWSTKSWALTASSSATIVDSIARGIYRNKKTRNK